MFVAKLPPFKKLKGAASEVFLRWNTTTGTKVPGESMRLTRP